jgi:phage gpG-like protein
MDLSLSLTEVDKFDYSKLLERLKRIEAVTDPQYILEKATTVVLARIRTRFLREVDPDEVPWLPSQAAVHRRSTLGTGTLFETGRLFRSIQEHFEPAPSVSTSSGQVRISTDVPYAKYHQLGIGQIARPFLGFSDNDGLVVERVLQNLIDKALN